MLYFAIKRGSTEIRIEVRSDLLTIDRQSVFGKNYWKLGRDQITNVLAAPSGEQMNNADVYQLEVHLADEPKLALMKHLPPQDLRWLAAQLRADLGIS